MWRGERKVSSHARLLEILEFTRAILCRRVRLNEFGFSLSEGPEKFSLAACMRDACCWLRPKLSKVSAGDQICTREGYGLGVRGASRTKCQCFVELWECLRNAFCTSLLWLAYRSTGRHKPLEDFGKSLLCALPLLVYTPLIHKVIIVWKVFTLAKATYTYMW